MDLPADLDSLATAIVELLRSAVKVAGHQSKQGMLHKAWWTEECTQAHTAMLAMRRVFPTGFNYEVQRARVEFQRTVNRARRTFFRTYIDNVKDSADIFKLTRSATIPPLFRRAI